MSEGVFLGEELIFKVNFFDVETTGLIRSGPNSSEIIEIAIHQYEVNKLNKEFMLIKEFDTLIKPQNTTPTHITKITNIENKDVTNSPCFIDIVDKIFEFKDVKWWLGHNASFDVDMIINELTKIGRTELLFDNNVLDTMSLAQLFDLHKIKQVELYAKIFEGGTYVAHRAKDDIIALKQIVEKSYKDRLIIL